MCVAAYRERADLVIVSKKKPQGAEERRGSGAFFCGGSGEGRGGGTRDFPAASQNKHLPPHLLGKKTYVLFFGVAAQTGEREGGNDPSADHQVITS